MALIRWEPFGELEHLFDNTFHPTVKGNFGWDLAVDVYEKDNNVIAEMNLPGIDADKVDISFEDEYHLHVSGSREEKQETKDKDYYSKEIRRGSFERHVRLPCPVEQSQTTAEYDNGVLRVTMPKKKESVVDKIKVKVDKK